MSCDSKINLLHYGQNVGIKHPDLILIRGIVERDHVRHCLVNSDNMTCSYCRYPHYAENRNLLYAWKTHTNCRILTRINGILHS
jgi:hypothetical protein